MNRKERKEEEKEYNEWQIYKSGAVKNQIHNVCIYVYVYEYK